MNAEITRFGRTIRYTVRRIVLPAASMLFICSAPVWTAEHIGRPRLFGTVDFGMSIKTQPKWLSVIKRNAASPIFIDGKQLTRSVTWHMLKNRVKDCSLLEKLDIVNRFWNAWPYRIDREVWGQEDFWATPAEFLEKSGDCEDYCIAKYFTLRELGISIDDMRIVVVKETIRGIGHAILAVYVGRDVYILDNLSNTVRPMNRIHNYKPYFSVNEKGRWMHVKAKTSAGSKRITEKGYGKKQ